MSSVVQLLRGHSPIAASVEPMAWSLNTELEAFSSLLRGAVGRFLGLELFR